MTSSEIL